MLRRLSHPDVLATTAGDRRPGWATDYPAAGDIEIAGMLASSGPQDPEERYCIRQVVEVSSGLAIGGIGWLGPPADGVVELGYGIVESRRGLGYATEAVCGMIDAAFADPEVKTVIAHVEPVNAPSIAVLRKASMRQVAPDNNDLRFDITR